MQNCVVLLIGDTHDYCSQIFYGVWSTKILVAFVPIAIKVQFYRCAVIPCAHLFTIHKPY